MIPLISACAKRERARALGKEPRGCPFAGFQDRCFQPLSHPSVAEYLFLKINLKKSTYILFTKLHENQTYCQIHTTQGFQDLVSATLN